MPRRLLPRRRDDLLPHAVATLWHVLTDAAEGSGIAPQIDAAVHTALSQQRDAELRRDAQPRQGGS